MDKRRKELLFLAAGLAILLVALYSTFKPATRTATAQPPAGATPAATAQAAAEPSAQIQPSGAPIPMSEGGTTDGRNPFRPVIATQPAAPPGSAPPPPPTMIAALSTRPLPPIEPMPLQLFGPGGGSPPGPSVLTPGPQAPPAEPAWHLTGVIYGDPSMAIIRKGAKRYFVRPGDPVGGRYVVQSISHRRVVLASDEGTLQLDLTGRL